jgi:hypothetical protein
MSRIMKKYAVRLSIVVAIIAAVLQLVVNLYPRTVSWGSVNFPLREGESGLVVTGASVEVEVHSLTSFKQINTLFSVDPTDSCLMVEMEPVMTSVFCASGETSTGPITIPLSLGDDMALYQDAWERLQAHIKLGGAVVEDRPKVVDQLLDQQWSVFSPVQRFAFNGGQCYGFTAQRKRAQTHLLEAYGLCATVNGPGVLWGSFSDLSRLNSTFNRE